MKLAEPAFPARCGTVSGTLARLHRPGSASVRCAVPGKAPAGRWDRVDVLGRGRQRCSDASAATPETWPPAAPRGATGRPPLSRVPLTRDIPSGKSISPAEIKEEERRPP
jgi:hypothetical protein